MDAIGDTNGMDRMDRMGEQRNVRLPYWGVNDQHIDWSRDLASATAVTGAHNPEACIEILKRF